MEENEVYASECIETYSKDYAHENFKSFFPCMVDGLKCVYRRVIYAFAINGLENGKIIKSTEAVAKVSMTHPTGDSSMYDVLMKMSQPWFTSPPMTISPSNNGTYSGNSPGAMRYTEIGLAPYTKEMYLDDIDTKALRKVEGPYLNMEPAYYVPALPTALLIDNTTIGFGIGCKTNRLNFSNVCDLVINYSNYLATKSHEPWNYKNLAEKFLPDYPTPCVITNASKLVEEYKKGNFDYPVDVEGKVIFSKDQIHIKAAPYGTPMQVLIEKWIKYWNNNPNSELRRLVKDYNFTRSKKLEGDFTIYCKQNVSPFSVWKLAHSIIGFSDRVHPKPNYTLEDQVTTRHFSYPELIRVWYTERCKLLLATKSSKLKQLLNQKQILEGQIIVVDHAKKFFEIVNDQPNVEEAIKALEQEFNITPFQCRALLNLSNQSFIKTSKTKLIEDLKKLVESIKELNDSYGNIGKEISTKALYFKKKYGKGRNSHIPNYIGYVKFSQGNILYENHDDVESILDSFPREECEVIPFTTPHQKPINENGKFSNSTFSKIMYGAILSLPNSDPKKVYTSCIKNGCLSFSKEAIPTLSQEGVFYTTKKIIGFTRYGEIKHDEITNYSKRNNCLDSRGSFTDFVHLMSETQNPFYLISFYSEEKNSFRLERIDPRSSKYVYNACGDQYLFTSVDGNNWYITPPKACLNRLNMRVLYVADVEGLLKGKSSVKVELSTRSRGNSCLQYLE